MRTTGTTRQRDDRQRENTNPPPNNYLTLHILRSKSKDAGITCLFTEFPSNPLLNVPDLIKVSESSAKKPQ